MSTSLVSICIPTFNGEKYLKACLDSAISQTYKNIEIVVVDDKSEDKTISIISEYQQRDKRIILYQNTKNLGLVGNWNQCIDHAHGEWIKYLFQDDYMSESTIERMMQFASEKNRFMVCNRAFLFEEGVSESIRSLYSSVQTKLSNTHESNEATYISPKEMSKKIAQWKHINYIGEPTSVLFPKSIVNEIGYFNRLLAQHCDLEYWFRISSNYGIFYIPERLVTFRVHNESTSNTNRKNEEDIRDVVIILYELCFGNSFKRFRQQINIYRLWALKRHLGYRLYILKKHLTNSLNVGKENSYLNLTEQFPYIKTRGTAATYYFLNPLVLIRRYILKMFKMAVRR